MLRVENKSKTKDFSVKDAKKKYRENSKAGQN